VQGQLDALQPLDSRQFHVAIKRLADSLSFGTDRSPFLGSGIEYVQSRPYVPGDPIRSIDWRVTARTGRVHVKDYEAPKQMPCWILLDTSASMATGSTAKTKYATALHVAGGLAYAFLDRVSPCGVLGVGERELRIEPTLSRQQALQWLLELRTFRYDEKTSLAARCSELAARLNSRALIVAITDLHEDGAVQALKLLGQRHDVIVLRMRDPAERDLRGAGVLRLQEAETGRTFVTHGRAKWLDDLEVEQELRRAGIDQFTIDTDRPFAQKLRHFCRFRGVFSKGAR
jgi:hypothetical protein